MSQCVSDVVLWSVGSELISETMSQEYTEEIMMVVIGVSHSSAPCSQCVCIQR